MRILYHHRTRGGDAQGVHIREVQDAFRRLGHEVKEVGLAPRVRHKVSLGSPERRSFLGAILYEGLSLAYNPVGTSRIVRCARRFRPDFLYERYTLHCLAGVTAARRLGIPSVIEVNSPLALEMERTSRLVLPWLARATERWILRRADVIVVVSKVLAEHCVREGASRDRILVLPNAVRLDRFHPQVFGDGVRRRYGLEGRAVVGFVGWIRRWHRVDLVLEALAKFPPEHRPYFLVVGDGPALGDLKGTASGLGLDSWIRLAGAVPRDEIPSHVAAMDICVLPDIPEYASPMKVFEYMAMGKPVVAPDQENLREIIEPGVTGLLFRPGDSAALSSALKVLLDHVEERREIGRQAARWIQDADCTWERNVREVLTRVSAAREPCVAAGG